MIVADGGFGARLNAMHKWHDAHGIPAVSGQAGVRTHATSFVVADLVTATLFQKGFGTVTESGTNPPKTGETK